MVVKVSKPEINVREKISELDKPSGTAGEAMLRAETPQEQFNLISAGRRNLIINGAMAFSQRNGTSLITLNSGGSVLYEFDRWARQVYQNGKLTLQQVTDAPSGFSYSIKATTASAITGSGSDYYMIRQPIEGFNSAHLAYGTSSARTTTLSFWVKSTLTGQWSGSIKNAAGNRAYTFPYYINSPSTWEYKTVIIPGDTSGTWVGSTNGTGLAVMYDLGTSRADLHGTLNSWTATNSYGSSTGVKLVQNASATWQVTGVQLELGKVATPFEHRSYGEELALCERYFQKVPIYNESILGQAYSTTAARFPIQLPVQMRATPTLTVPPPGSSGNSFKPLSPTLSWPGGTGNNAGTALSNRHFYITCTSYSGLVAGNASTIYSASNNIFITASAEL
jgi:hypothetical protein